MKNLSSPLLVLLCVSLCFTSCSDGDSDDPEVIDLIIIPGQGINELKIGDPGSQVEVELGTGYERIVNVGASGNATYNYYNDSEGVDVIFGQQSSGDLEINDLPIKSFNLFGQFSGMTAEGIKIGSTMDEVIAAYGQPDEMDMWANVYYIGLIISYDDMDLVQDITILEI